MATKNKKHMKKATAVKKAKPTTVKKSQMMTKATAKPVMKMTEKSSKTPGRAKASMRLISPLDDRLVIRVDAAEEKTAGGLYIPTNAAERPNRGEVVAAGPGRRNKQGTVRPLDVNVGDNVLFPQYSGSKIFVDDQEFLILREDEVLGIVTT